MWPMVATHFIKSRVPAEFKELVQQAAAHDLITESVWLKRLVFAAVKGRLSPQHSVLETPDAGGHSRSRRHDVRLRPEDHRLLLERASARGLRPATYISVLTRSHLRLLPPLPQNELVALKKSVSELGAIGRNLNQIARVANQSGHVTGPNHDDIKAILRVCQALRDHTKNLIKANTTSWELGYGP